MYFRKHVAIFYLAILTSEEEARIKKFHVQDKVSCQARGFMYKEMGAPSDHVRKVIRRFDRPEVYIRFLVGCCLLHGAGGLGRVRRVWLQPEFPSKCSIEKIERLDDENQVLSSQILGGEHRLRKYTPLRRVTSDWIAGN